MSYDQEQQNREIESLERLRSSLTRQVQATTVQLNNMKLAARSRESIARRGGAERISESAKPVVLCRDCQERENAKMRIQAREQARRYDERIQGKEQVERYDEQQQSEDEELKARVERIRARLQTAALEESDNAVPFEEDRSNFAASASSTNPYNRYLSRE